VHVYHSATSTYFFCRKSKQKDFSDTDFLLFYRIIVLFNFHFLIFASFCGGVEPEVQPPSFLILNQKSGVLATSTYFFWRKSRQKDFSYSRLFVYFSSFIAFFILFSTFRHAELVSASYQRRKLDRS